MDLRISSSHLAISASLPLVGRWSVFVDRTRSMDQYSIQPLPFLWNSPSTYVVSAGVIHTPMSRSVNASTTDALRSASICLIVSGIVDEGAMKVRVVVAA